jgi:hypothetical protein
MPLRPDFEPIPHDDLSTATGGVHDGAPGSAAPGSALGAAVGGNMGREKRRREETQRH